MSAVIHIDNASMHKNIPDDGKISYWVNHALKDTQTSNAELSIRIVDKVEIQTLNSQYRNKDKPTNVLSFPVDLPDAVTVPLLGDIVICAAIVIDEAKEQNKKPENHWAHMIIHGVLHLLGYDHIDDKEAQIMERLETELMLSLGLRAPYEIS